MLTISLLTALALTAPPAAAEVRAGADTAVVPHCQVFLIDDVEVPALETGPLAAVHVREGQFVRQNDLLAQIDDKQPQLAKLSAEVEQQAAQAKADDDIDVRYAQKAKELAESELHQDWEIKRRTPGAVTEAEIRRKQLLVTRETLGVDRAKLDQQIAQLTADVKQAAVESANDSILRRRVVAPFDGMVADVLRQKSEWVNSGEMVARVVRLDRLRVDGFLNGELYNPSDVKGRQVTVEIELARGRREQFRGTVVFVDPFIQAGKKYRIRAEVDNRFEEDEPLLRPGSTATMVVHLR